MSIFLSYSTKNRPFINQLTPHLQKNNIPYWVDYQDINPGMRFRDELFKQLKQCSTVVAILSPEYLQSEYCRMEIFVAKSFGKTIIPIMLEDCFEQLSEYEETNGLDNLFMMLIYAKTHAGIPASLDEMFQKLTTAIQATEKPPELSHQAYISFSREDASFAANTAKQLENLGTPSWVFTTNVYLGENWRESQTRAMLAASSHLVVLSEKLINSKYIQIELLLSESLNLPLYTILPPRLSGYKKEIDIVMASINRGNKTQRRMGERQFFTEKSIESLHQTLLNQKALKIT